jgi:uncharacterized protein
MNDIKVNHKIHPALAIASVILLFTITAVLAVAVPQLKGRVNDYAGMLSAYTQRQLDDTLRQLEKTDSTQIAVLTITSLQGDNLEAFSIRVAEQWKIGQKGFDNGAILLIAKKERKIRIEVGYGLEGRLTDLVSGQIIRNVILPQFRAGNIDRGISDGVQAMIKVVRGEFRAPDNTSYRTGRKSGSHFNLFSLIVFLAVINMLGRLRRPIGAAAGGLIFPTVGALFFNTSLMWVLALIPLGVLGGQERRLVRWFRRRRFFIRRFRWIFRRRRRFRRRWCLRRVVKGNAVSLE